MASLTGPELATILTAMVGNKWMTTKYVYPENAAWMGYHNYFRPLSDAKRNALINRLSKELRSAIKADKEKAHG